MIRSFLIWLWRWLVADTPRCPDCYKGWVNVEGERGCLFARRCSTCHGTSRLPPGVGK